jgi:tetratricopeptide (TPR) repeat protein
VAVVIVLLAAALLADRGLARAAAPAAAPEISWERPARGQSGLQAGTYDGVARTWRRFVELFDKEDFAEVLVRVEQLEDVRLDNGLPNLFDASAVLARAARARAVAGDSTTARQLAQAALRVAPDLPQPNYVLAELLMQESRGNFGGALAHVARGWMKEWSHLPSRMRLLADSLTTVLLAYLLVLFLVALVQLRRHFPALTHDVGHLFPRGVTPIQAALFTLLLLFTPLFFSLGVLTLLLLWNVAMWWYQSRQEKVVVVLLLVGALTLPFLGRVTTSAVRWFTGPLTVYHECLEGACSEPQVEWLEATCQAAPADALRCYTLATVRLRQGVKAPLRIDEALAYLEPLAGETGGLGRAIQVATGNALQAKAVAHCTFQRRIGGSGIDDAYRTLAGRATAAYERAAALGAGAAPLYNRSVMLRRLGETDEADRLLAQALDAGDDEVSEIQRASADDPQIGPCSESFNANRRLAPPPLPSGPLFSAALAATALGDAQLPLLHDALLGSLTPPLLLLVALGLLLAGLILQGLRARMHPSWRCAQCHRVGCVRCRRELEHLDLCEECLFIKVKGSFVDAKELWFRERRIQQEEDAQRRIGRGLTFVAPGAGHVYRGHALAGLVLLSLFATFVLLAAARSGVAPDTALVGDGAGLAATIGWSIAAGVVYVIALVSIYRRR